MNVNNSDAANRNATSGVFATAAGAGAAANTPEDTILKFGRGGIAATRLGVKFESPGGLPPPQPPDPFIPAVTRSMEIIPAGGFGGGLNTAPPELTVDSSGVAFAATVPMRRLGRVARR